MACGAQFPEAGDAPADGTRITVVIAAPASPERERACEAIERLTTELLACVTPIASDIAVRSPATRYRESMRVGFFVLDGRVDEPTFSGVTRPEWTACQSKVLDALAADGDRTWHVDIGISGVVRHDALGVDLGGAAFGGPRHEEGISAPEGREGRWAGTRR